MSANAYINRIATAVPQHEVHQFYLRYAASMLCSDRRKLFERMAGLAGIDHRFSCFAPALDPEGPSVDLGGIFKRGAFPGTAARMAMFAEAAPALAQKGVDGLHLGNEASRITHLIVTTCTGFSAPGIDLDLVQRCGLADGVERTMIGFMGCYAAVNGLKLARHIVRSDPGARVLLVNIEICTLHIRETTELEKLLCFCLWGDGCAASIVTAEPPGIELDSFRCAVANEQRELMTWDIRDQVSTWFFPARYRPLSRKPCAATGTRSSEAGRRKRSTSGLCIPAAAAFSTPSKGRLNSSPPRSSRRARCCANMATCRRQPSCS